MKVHRAPLAFVSFPKENRAYVIALMKPVTSSIAIKAIIRQLMDDPSFFSREPSLVVRLTGGNRELDLAWTSVVPDAKGKAVQGRVRCSLTF
jgi:hypothetical protein